MLLVAVQLHITNTPTRSMCADRSLGNLFLCVRNNSPDLYMDKRGNLHVLTHNQSPCYSGRAASFFGADVRGCGAHFFSSDMGASWKFAWHAVYNGTVV